MHKRQTGQLSESVTWDFNPTGSPEGGPVLRLKRPGKPAIEVHLNEMGATLHLEGYADAFGGNAIAMLDLSRMLIGLEPAVQVWADSKQEAPTHTITLEGARRQVAGAATLTIKQT